MKLSLIIPAYNAEPFLSALLNALKDQVTPEVEVIIVDDGSKIPVKSSWAKVYRQKNGGASAARNKGIELSTGEYIAFIDADDLVSGDYIERIMEKIDEGCDYVWLSWQTLPGGWDCKVILKDENDRFPPFNLCVWNRVYSRKMIGKTRFNEKKLIAEDAEFIREVGEEGKKGVISEPIYFYRSNTPDSLTKRFASGDLDTRRAVYHYRHVTADMTYLIDEFRELDKEAEVILMTEQNDLPELAKYAMIVKPMAMKGTEFHGEPYPFYTNIELPIRTQVVIWTSVTFKIGGIETFIYAFCKNLAKKKDILVLYETIDPIQRDRLSKIVRCEHAGPKIVCDTLIVNRISDKNPPNVTFKQKIQMVHSCRLNKAWTVPMDADKIVTVSQVVKDSFDVDAEVIHNLTVKEKPEELLTLVSTTRLGTFEKGIERMTKFANLLKRAGIPFLWMVFSDKAPQMVEGMAWMGTTLNVAPYMAKADFLVQLSDSEGYGYAIVEALEMGTPVITTPIPVLEELGFKEGVHGHIVSFEVDKLPNLDRLKPVSFDSGNAEKVKKWIKILGPEKPKGDYKPSELVRIRAKQLYIDSQLGRTIQMGETVLVPRHRAMEIIEANLAELM